MNSMTLVEKTTTTTHQITETYRPPCNSNPDDSLADVSSLATVPQDSAGALPSRSVKHTKTDDKIRSDLPGMKGAVQDQLFGLESAADLPFKNSYNVIALREIIREIAACKIGALCRQSYCPRCSTLALTSVEANLDNIIQESGDLQFLELHISSPGEGNSGYTGLEYLRERLTSFTQKLKVKPSKTQEKSTILGGVLNVAVTESSHRCAFKLHGVLVCENNLDEAKISDLQHSLKGEVAVALPSMEVIAPEKLHEVLRDIFSAPTLHVNSRIAVHRMLFPAADSSRKSFGCLATESISTQALVEMYAKQAKASCTSTKKRRSKRKKIRD